MTRLWGPTLPSVHPSLPRSLPSHCTLFFPPFFFCFCLLPSVFPFPLFFTISPFSSSLFLSRPFPLAPCLSPSSVFPRFTSSVPSFLVLLNSSSPFFDGVHSSVPSFPPTCCPSFFLSSLFASSNLQTSNSSSVSFPHFPKRFQPVCIPAFRILTFCHETPLASSPDMQRVLERRSSRLPLWLLVPSLIENHTQHIIGWGRPKSCTTAFIALHAGLNLLAVWLRQENVNT